MTPSIDDRPEDHPGDRYEGRYKTLRVSREGPVLRVRLNLPETGNTLTAEVLDELLTVLGGLNDRPGIRVLVLSGAGDDFCLGADREEFTTSLGADPTGAELRVIMDKARRVCEALDTTTAVTVARLHGRVIGAGLALAVFCDLRIGADTCRFRLPEVALGVAPVWGGVLPRLIGEAGAARIRELILTCAPFDAERAHELSVLHRVVPAAELDASVASWTGPLLRRPAGALPLAKLVLGAYSRGSRFMDGSLLDAQLLSSACAAGVSRRE
ncbi:enoyl-CoA hydratase/isomerase family protein [Streptomyces sp. TRM 70361]|uniref:enoyl-CoA hydratase/isomerase family protein n=1 Tax=Streptomyces sp. TRM 70361 TaxID=3116553 RepID=UPI002E7B1132|nr:enoyl-CoA hydratase/isomerase family protein [Streptomyces sp. TRM 70361]MEE1942124.1 enoyl-CoA hydratase/isomerase family protein [Streptomyces sp. TRM 70361]